MRITLTLKKVHFVNKPGLEIHFAANEIYIR
jgi:hypothetical protein